MYTIGEISKMFHVPVSTLRYYDKEGLFPNLERSSGIRQFSDKEIETMKLIECLKRSGMEIKDIKQFIEWCSIGSETYQQRYEMFLKRKERVERELQQMQKTLDMLRYKCWYYEQALKDGNEDRILAMLPNHLPEDIQELYDHAHED
ncbi:MAG TPA: MerR family transcriptional regulator [Candidatus Fimousia stercorigallinarum]|nr:MerR family transcriptional regulator [Candidatus Fimousia stercorigallinarum]